MKLDNTLAFEMGLVEGEMLDSLQVTRGLPAPPISFAVLFLLWLLATPLLCHTSLPLILCEVVEVGGLAARQHLFTLNLPIHPKVAVSR